MIAACPKCAARYRVERERLHAGGVRLRCARCEAVFRVRPPDAPAPAAQPVAGPKREAAPPAAVEAPPPARGAEAKPARAASAEANPAPAASVEASPAPAAVAETKPAPAPQGAGEVVLVAMPAGEAAQRSARLLAQRGLRVLTATDGVEAMLEIQRKLPRAVVLAADLPKMYGFQICEVLKRNESLRGIWVVLVGAIHHPERYRREPGELYGADAYVDGPELPAGLLPVLARGGIAAADAAAPAAVPAAKAAPSEPPAAKGPLPEPPATKAPLPEPHAVTLRAPASPAPRREPAAAPPRATAAPARPPAAVRPAGPARRGDGLDEERAKAERLARIVVSDIVLYNEQRFAAAARTGNVVEAMAADLAEGRQLFEERIDRRVRAERDHLTEELLRRAQAQGMH
jgi:predicted Zn finger-like uncharacterized protein